MKEIEKERKKEKGETPTPFFFQNKGIDSIGGLPKNERTHPEEEDGMGW